jgi:hypothetical protein
MAGKASLLLVLGFSLLFLVFGHNFNTVSTRTVENFTDYYSETVAHDLAVSGANLGANAVYLDNKWDTGYKNLKLNGGEVEVKIEVLNAVQNIRKLISTANYNGTKSIVEVIFSPRRFSEYAYFSESEGNNIWWMNRDSVFGPFHTQDNLRAANHPVFGIGGYRSTIRGKLIYYDSKKKDAPEFHGSFQDGVDEPLKTNGLEPLRDAAEDEGFKINYSETTVEEQVWVPGGWQYIWGQGWVNTPGHWETNTVTYKDTVYLTFANDSVKVKMGYDKPETTYKSEEIAPNGVIYAEGMDIKLKGTVEGQYSVVSDNNIWLEDDIVYSKDPRIYPGSTDILGIIAQDEVIITDNNATKNIKIHGAIYCEDGGFGADNYDGRGDDGYINLLGGITQKIRRAVGTFSGNSVKDGFAKRYRYDDRLQFIFPPFFPTTGGFKIVSWKE